MADILVTGFEPFAGREVNGSWLTACIIKEKRPDLSLEVSRLPVIWGKPRQILEQICSRNCPRVILSLGEGKPGRINIETRAKNQRARRRDNLDTLPDTPLSFPDDSDERLASLDAPALQDRINAKGYQVRLSTNAGQFLCEETLFTLERLKDHFPGLQTVLFVHLPPYGTPVFGADPRSYDESFMEAFGPVLMDCVLDLHATSLMQA